MSGFVADYVTVFGNNGRSLISGCGAISEWVSVQGWHMHGHAPVWVVGHKHVVLL
ncbi:MAG: hypothetical protein PF517_07785 [Salinivirgaceae bacterium]|nr:hypothetical protein [Salinivirgaceae bacterium]